MPDPKILNARDAIVRITSTAICGSDLHLYNGFIPTMEKGDILGHEFMGEVVEVGRGVKNLRVGDRVVVPFPIACGACCAVPARDVLAVRELEPERVDGREAVGPLAVRASSATRTCSAASPAARPSTRACRSPTSARSRCPTSSTDEQVLFLSDIFPTGYMGAEMCDIKPGDVVAVWGCGPVGQFAIAERLPARRRARHRDRSLPVPPATWRASSAGAETHQLRGGRRPRGAARDDRRPRPRRVHRRGRHGGARPRRRCARTTGPSRC